jgi:anti-sigma regulatory factor (Ser/Thr protein kinase)
MWNLRVHLQTELPALRAIRRLVASACRNEGASELDAGLVEVSLGEALANARLHAYSNGIGPLIVDVEYDRPQMTLWVHNDGAPVVARSTIPDEWPGHESRGWGLYVIGRVMDEVEVSRAPHTDQGTSIRMMKRLDEA